MATKVAKLTHPTTIHFAEVPDGYPSYHVLWFIFKVQHIATPILPRSSLQIRYKGPGPGIKAWGLA